MMKKSVSGGWKAVVLILLFLSELVLCAGILGNIEGVCNFLTAHGLEAVVTFLHRTLFFLIEVGAAVVLIIDTMIAAITKVTRKFPSLMTVLAFIYNDLAAIATVFGIYMFGQPKAWFPYPLAFLIPAITFLLTLICLIDDFVHDKGVLEEAPNVTKMAAQTVAKPKEEELRSARPAGKHRSPKRSTPNPRSSSLPPKRTTGPSRSRNPKWSPPPSPSRCRSTSPSMSSPSSRATSRRTMSRPTPSLRSTTSSSRSPIPITSKTSKFTQTFAPVPNIFGAGFLVLITLMW